MQIYVSDYSYSRS